MADKETASYEAAAGQQKPPTFQLPVMANNSEKRKHQLQQDDTNKVCNGNNGAPSGYNFNVAQKGKLILPTALWILLIIAGICFLTLLASLNKTMGTLDELIEIEQDKVSKLNIIENHHHNNRKPQMKHSLHREQTERPISPPPPPPPRVNKPDDMLDFEFGNEVPIESSSWFDLTPKASWFTLPSWTSLEPQSRPAHHNHQNGPPLRRLPSPLLPMRPGDAEDEISGSIIVASGSGFDDTNNENSLLQSIFKQIMPIFGAGEINGPLIEDMPTVTKKQPMDAAGDQAQNGAPAFISAKIDKINININNNNSADEKKQQQQQQEENNSKGQPKKNGHKGKEYEDAASLESSIDSIVSKLMSDESRPLTDRPIMSPSMMMQQHSSEDEMHNRPSMGSLVDLLMPIGPSGPQDQAIMIETPPISNHLEEDPLADMLNQLAQLHNQPHHPKHHHQHHLHQRPKLDGPVPVVITMDEPSQPVKVPHSHRPPLFGSQPSGELFRHGLSNTRRPSFGQSPYELNQLPMNEIFFSMKPQEHGNNGKPSVGNDGGPWNMIADDLAGALMQGLLQEPANQPFNDGSFVLINGKPLASGEQQKLTTMSQDTKPSSTNNKIHNKNGASELFNMLFGPPPDSNLVVLKPKLENKEEPERSESKLLGEPNPINLTGSISVSDMMTTSEDQPKTTVSISSDELPSSLSSIMSLPTLDLVTSTSRSPSEDDDNIRPQLDSIMSTIFALPQSSGQSGPVRVNDNSSPSSSSSQGQGGSSGENSSSSPKADNSNESEPTIILESNNLNNIPPSNK